MEKPVVLISAFDGWTVEPSELPPPETWIWVHGKRGVCPYAEAIAPLWIRAEDQLTVSGGTVSFDRDLLN